jgi:hypothetical protein
MAQNLGENGAKGTFGTFGPLENEYKTQVRAEIAGWPAPWREALVDRIRDLESQGLPSLQAECMAMASLYDLRDGGTVPPDATAADILGRIGN